MSFLTAPEDRMVPSGIKSKCTRYKFGPSTTESRLTVRIYIWSRSTRKLLISTKAADPTTFSQLILSCSSGNSGKNPRSGYLNRISSRI